MSRHRNPMEYCPPDDPYPCAGGCGRLIDSAELCSECAPRLGGFPTAEEREAAHDDLRGERQ